MAVSETLPELVHAARCTAQAAQDRMAEILKLAENQALTDAQAAQVDAETLAIEAAAVDIFAVFEARMQGHFKRGPLSRKVVSALTAAGHTDLADALHDYYLAINVLKHGPGASYRELSGKGSAMLAATPAASGATKSEGAPSGLIEVTAPRFFDGLADTILNSYEFLEGR